ncbi:unnamed protein product [Effrenium voratum]|nr:unnamed protein product [Effrenium voratum]
MAAMEVDQPKRHSMYTPPPGRETKRTKSEEAMHQPHFDEELVQSKTMGDIMTDLQSLSDDFSQQESQVRYLLWQTAERQRQEASSKISVKNWWKYEPQGNKDYYMLESHRKALVQYYAMEAGISEDKLRAFSYSNYMGRNLSPFCVVDVGDARTRQVFLEHMKKTHSNRVTEWIAQEQQEGLKTLKTDRSNKADVNGKLVFEPMIATFDKIQSVPLKLAMATVSELRPDLTWQKDWQHNTVYTPDTRGDVQRYLVWCALDHLHGKCIVYINQDEFDKKVFRDTLAKHEYQWMARKGWGKGKGKALSMIEGMTMGEALNPEGSFLEQIGLTKGAGKGKKNGHGSVMEKAMKSELPFRMDVQAIGSTEYVKTYNEHLYRLLKRWS